MASLHCKKQGCGWTQDEFWSEAYSPLHGGYFDDTRKLLLEHLNRPSANRFVEAPLEWAEEMGIPYTECDGKGRILTNEYLAWEMDQRAGLFRSQVYWTNHDFQAGPRCCPQCGSDQLSTEEIKEQPVAKKPVKKAAKKKTPKKEPATPPDEPLPVPKEQQSTKAMSAYDRQVALQRRTGIKGVKR